MLKYVQALYQVLSEELGDTQMKNLKDYTDFQDNSTWVTQIKEWNNIFQNVQTSADSG